MLKIGDKVKLCSLETFRENKFGIEEEHFMKIKGNQFTINHKYISCWGLEEDPRGYGWLPEHLILIKQNRWL